jgi:carbon-monoxide dehydrogenase medium subunit
MGAMGFHEPATIDAAAALLAADGEARCLAGGATLVAMMNARLVEPSALVSLRHIDEMRGIEPVGDGFRIGAMTPHRVTATEGRLAGGHATLREAAAVIANPGVRNMGTIGGSIAFADPAADYSPALVAIGAEIGIVASGGRRRVTAADFFPDGYETALEPGELIVSIHLPAAPAGAVGVYDKLARVEGDFAIASAAVVLAMVGDVCSHLRIAVGGCGPTPLRLAAAEAGLLGGGLDAAAVYQAGEMLAQASDPLDDVRASADYRRLVIPRLIARAIGRARAGS